MNPPAANSDLRGSLLVPTLCLLMAGCATQAAHTEAPRAFELVDQRSGGEDSTQWMSDKVASCDYTLRQIGDEETPSDRFALLREDLDSTLHEELTGKQLLVTHYAIYLNSMERSRESSFSVNGNLLGSLAQQVYLGHVARRCREELLAQGKLEPDDVKGHRTPVIVEITLIVDGRTHSVRSLFSPYQQLSIKPKDPDTSAAILHALDKAIKQLIAEMRLT